jgi:2-keto-4-pentenoate hydratase/2-oxohepta-3-ene-1,7-dioic acid hydratase in catechol pathway
MSIDKIICVGKNYLDHAKELGDAIPEKPVIFLKPASVLKQVKHWNETLELNFPSEDPAVQPECEIILQVAHDAYQLTREEAKHAIASLTIGLDMTLRMRQTALKKEGHPWTTAKVFKDAAIIGPWINIHQFDDYRNTEFQLFIDGQLKQASKGSNMMMQPEDLLVYISYFFPLKAGDIIFTGTPAGVTSITQGNLAQLCWGSYSYHVQWR